MAVPGNFGVYGFGFLAGAGANREDLLDLITNVDPYDTPWVTQAPKVRAQHVVHEWLTDTLAGTATAGEVEGADWNMTANAFTATTRPVRVLNVTQIFRKDIGVSETQRAVNPAGFKDAYAYEVQKATKELARNLEATLFVTASASASGANAVGRQMKTFRAFETATATGAGQTVSALSTATAAGSAIAGVLTTVSFNNALERCYLNGGNPEQCYVSPAIKRQISQFTATNQNRNIAAVDKKLVAAMDLYDSDFGLIQIVMDRWVPQATNTATATATGQDVSGNLWFLERSKNRLAWLRPMAHTLVGKRGDSVAGMVLGEVTLEVLNPLANFVITQANNVTA
jgi:hypothetical protein